MPLPIQSFSARPDRLRRSTTATVCGSGVVCSREASARRSASRADADAWRADESFASARMTISLNAGTARDPDGRSAPLSRRLGMRLGCSMSG